MKRLPAFGRALMERRDRGDHPQSVVVLAGADWSGWRQAEHPLAHRLAVMQLVPPDAFDWSICTGLAAFIVPRGMDWVWCWHLAGVLAAYAAPVCVQESGSLSDMWRAGRSRDVADLALDWRDDLRFGHAHSWPPWWSERLAADYAARWREAEALLACNVAASLSKPPPGWAAAIIDEAEARAA